MKCPNILDRIRGHIYKYKYSSKESSASTHICIVPSRYSPSEKAFAYKMKYEAIKRKAGRRKCGQVDHNLGKKSIELIGEECGDSPKQVQLHRFFPVTYTAEQMRREILEMLKLNMKKYWDA